MKDDKPIYTYNFLGLVALHDCCSPTRNYRQAKQTVVLDFKYDGGGLGKGGMATLSVNGKTVAEGRIEKTQPLIFSADETADVGLDNQTPVAEGHRHWTRRRLASPERSTKMTVAVKDVK